MAAQRVAFVRPAILHPGRGVNDVQTKTILFSLLGIMAVAAAYGITAQVSQDSSISSDRDEVLAEVEITGVKCLESKSLMT